MSSTRFIEGDLIFHFPADWGVRKYDKQRFYRHMGGMGLKGVDFVAIDPREQGHLYLIEVKNYRTRYREEMVFEAPLKEQDELAEIVATKYEHTLKAIRAINLYYRRKWWYKQAEGTLQKSRRWRFDLIFWTHAYRLAKVPKTHSMVLWMETEEPAKLYREHLATELHERLPEQLHTLITHQEAPHTLGFKVEVHSELSRDR